MDVQEIPVALRTRLGAEATAGLIEVLDRSREECTAAVMTLVGDRFERRLTEEISKLRVEMHQGFADVRTEMTNHHASLRNEMSHLKVDLLRWSFLFWLGQVATVTAILGLLLRR